MQLYTVPNDNATRMRVALRAYLDYLTRNAPTLLLRNTVFSQRLTALRAMNFYS